MEPDVPVENRAGLPDDAFARIKGQVSGHRSMRLAVDWLAAHAPRLSPSGMVTQDEYSHDVLVPYPGGLWLAYDST